MVCLKIWGKSLSIMLTSLEKRLKIRPNGVVSKNCIGFFNKLFNVTLCSFSAAVNAPIRRTATNVNTATAARFQKCKNPSKKTKKSQRLTLKLKHFTAKHCRYHYRYSP